MVDINVFNTKLVEYYKEHDNEYVKKITIQYVEKTYAKNNLGLLLTAIMKSHPYKYGYPDVSAIEKAHTLYVKDGGMSLKNKNGNTEWSTAIKPLTDKEREEANGNRQKWENLVKDAAINNKVKQDHKCQTCAHITETGENYFCRGCIGYSKYETRGESDE